MGWVILGVLAVGFVTPFLMELRRKIPNAKDAPGEIVKLSGGATHYRWFGPEGGPVIVAVHGLTTPSLVWSVIAQGLAKRGYRVLTYDLYGRGFSAAPMGRQDRAFYLRQLTELLEDQGIEDGFTLMGYSMGGSIVAAFSAAYPDRVLGMVLVAPAGMGSVVSRFSRFAAAVPVLGDWVQAAFYPRRARRGLAAEGPGRNQVAGLYEAQLAEVERRGASPAVLSSRRGMLAEILEAEHRAIGAEGIEVLAVWGRDDPVIPIQSVGLLAQWNRAAEQVVIEGADHGLPYTHPREVLAAIEGWLGAE